MRAFYYVKPALLKDKAYELYVMYVDAKQDFQALKRLYERTVSSAKDPRLGADIAEHGNETFRNGCATLDLRSCRY